LLQLYLWAVNATQFVADMRMDGGSSSSSGSLLTASVDNFDSLLINIDSYVEQHPQPMTSSENQALLDECRRVGCHHLLNKLEAAQSSCTSAVELIRARQVL
jgi:hypothetical protein